MIIKLVDDAVRSGARPAKACELLGLSKRTVQRWRASDKVGDLRAGPKTSPANKFSAPEREKVIEVANRPEFRDLSPKQIVPLLADSGRYVGSESTMYRVLREKNQLAHRRSASPRKRSKPNEYTATGARQVLTWDITYLPTTIRGRFFYLYMVMDIWSRKIVGWSVHDVESPDFAADLITQVARAERLGPHTTVLHADNGGPMKGATMLATLQRLGIAASFSRPRVSDDNPFSEALFGTFKGRPGYSDRRFADVAVASNWVTAFVKWYNNEHLHSAIGFVTPNDRHRGDDKQILENRRAVYAKAKLRNPRRWSKNHRSWVSPKNVHLNPRKTTLNTLTASSRSA